MATQEQIAEHLDLSRQSVSALLKDLRFDGRDADLDAVRIAYVRDLREKAAGRGGEHNHSLARARIREANANADLKELLIAEKAGQLVAMSDVEPRLVAMITAARQELLSLPEKLAGEIRALYNVDIDIALVESPIHDALNHLASDLSANDGDAVPAYTDSVGATAEDNDD